MRNSCGIMMNYRYVLEDMEDNHVRYEMTGEVAVCDSVRRWL
jgi:malonyl-CoA decarboxylase